MPSKKEKENKKGGNTTIGHRRRGFARVTYRRRTNTLLCSNNMGKRVGEVIYCLYLMKWLHDMNTKATITLRETLGQITSKKGMACNVVIQEEQQPIIMDDRHNYFMIS